MHLGRIDMQADVIALARGTFAHQRKLMGRRRKRRVIVDSFHDASKDGARRSTARMSIELIGIRIVHQDHAHVTHIFDRSKADKRCHLVFAIVLTRFLVVLFGRTGLSAK